MSEIKTKFTDVARREIECKIIVKEGVPVLAIEQILEGGERKVIMLLNMYDAKQLSAICERYLHEGYSANLSASPGAISPEEMANLFGNL